MNRGFTLIEFLVVISIVVLLALLVLPHYRRGEAQLTLRRSANKLAQDLRRAQEMAMSARKFEGKVPPRYGIKCRTAHRDHCILFADINGDGLYQVGLDKEVERITFERGVRVFQLLAGSPLSPRDALSITFKPPDPVTAIKKPRPPSPPLIFSVAQIVLTNEVETKTITINRVGLVYVK